MRKWTPLEGSFFWQGADEGNKYHMAKMDTICRPEDQGGMGILNTTRMNECLLVKWIWKIVQGSDDLWFKILQAKYMPNGNFFQSKTRGASQFWQGLHKVKHLFKWGAVYKVHNGEKISFWEDVWLGDVPLKIQFPTLFSFCEYHLVSVADSYDEGEWSIDLRRVLMDKRRIPLRSASVRTPHLFHHGIPKVLVNPRSKGITSVRSTTTH
jgi:hypothetical protein